MGGWSGFVLGERGVGCGAVCARGCGPERAVAVSCNAAVEEVPKRL